MCDGTVLRQVGEVPQGAADPQTPEDGKQFATAGQVGLSERVLKDWQGQRCNISATACFASGRGEGVQTLQLIACRCCNDQVWMDCGRPLSGGGHTHRVFAGMSPETHGRLHRAPRPRGLFSFASIGRCFARKNGSPQRCLVPGQEPRWCSGAGLQRGQDRWRRSPDQVGS